MFEWKSLSFFGNFFLLFFLIGCGNQKDSYPLYVKDTFHLMTKNANSPPSVATGFYLHFDLERKHSSKNVLDLQTNQDLFLVTNFHVVCCPDSPSSDSVEIFALPNNLNRLDRKIIISNGILVEIKRPVVSVKEPVAFSFVYDLAIFRLRKEDFLSNDPNFFVKHSKDFQQELKTSNDSFPFHIFGFSGKETQDSNTTKRRKMPAEFLSEFSDPFHIHFAASSFGYYDEYYGGLSGSPVLSSATEELMGVLKVTRPPGFLSGTDVVHLKNLLEKKPLDCSSLDLERGATCIHKFLIQHLEEVYEQAESGDPLSQYSLYRKIKSEEEKKKSTLSSYSIRDTICHIRNDPNCLDDKKLTQYITEAAKSGLREAQFLFPATDKNQFGLVLNAYQKKDLTSQFLLKIYCALERNFKEYNNICRRESRDSLYWLKKIADFGHIEAQFYYGKLLSCENKNPLVDCSNEESEKWIQMAQNHRDCSQEYSSKIIACLISDLPPNFKPSTIFHSLSQGGI